MVKPNVNSFLPLSPAVLHILVALAGEDRHGYGIMQAIARQSDDRYKLGPGTLYDNLRKLLSGGLVEEVARTTDDDDPRRRYYRLSGFGREVLSAELSRLEELAREAKRYLKPIPKRA
jgi:DNA-binding PadR family transcriptional regulator